MKLSRSQELALKKIVKDNFGNSWNYYHTLLAATWMKKLIKAEGGNEKILVVAMYLHDLGYSQTLNYSHYTLADRIKAKKSHMIIGAKMARKILEKLNFSRIEIEKVVHLVKVHDKIFKLKSKDEIMVMEADSLGGIDWKNLGPSFNKRDQQKFIKMFTSTRAKLFKTEAGKKYLTKLLSCI